MEQGDKKGYVYILVNPAFSGFVKVGKTTKEPESRARELSLGSGVPAPYAVAWDAFVTDCEHVERLIHQQLAHARARNDREFFAIPLKKAISIASNIVGPFSCETGEASAEPPGEIKPLDASNTPSAQSHYRSNQGRNEPDEEDIGIYKLFIEQTKLFLKALGEIEPSFQLLVDGRNVRPDNRGNWFTVFSPAIWGRKAGSKSLGPGSGYGSGVGVGYAFYYTRNINGDHYVRLSSSVENPFKKEYREKFKKDVSLAVVAQHAPLPNGCRIWPDTKFPGFRFQGTTLLECQPVPLEDNTWSYVCENYSILNQKFNELVAQLLRKYYEQGAFLVKLDFGY